MPKNIGERFDGSSLVQGLRLKSKRRREDLEQLAIASAPSRKVRNDILPQLVLETIPIKDLQISSRKLRKANAAHVREVANAIGAFGFCDPILVGKENLVVDGEVRIEAARQSGLSAVPCIRVGHLNHVEQRALRLAANRLSEKGNGTCRL